MKQIKAQIKKQKIPETVFCKMVAKEVGCDWNKVYRFLHSEKAKTSISITDKAREILEIKEPTK